ncbi:sterol desaturase family protein [Ottowia testudinis]|uniref:Sterol desaturase family protein n=1 Tax=Ottowia testudinis TaxID=2816950 RepID=A0A975CGN0_9BURK|nr:sterol desaturase family protein [Ottowia testudinis]QTD46055.1 sterol desaturase family protein [Ottowia testudinis]
MNATDTPLPDVLMAALPAFVLLILAGTFTSARRGDGRYRTRDTLANLALGGGYALISAAVGGVVLLVFSWLYSHRLFDLPMNAWWVWVLCFFADDFTYYWFHRISHESRWFWASHSVHHSSERYNFSVSLRQTWTGTLSGSFLFWAWMPLLGFHPAMVLFMQSVSLIYQFWIHTEAIGRLPGWFETVFNTPSHHRVHHGSDEEYLDRNYAGTLIVWDRLFGSFHAERHTPRYGLTHPVGSDNPLRIAFHEWIGIWRDLRRARSGREVWGYLFAPPGWSADGSSLTTQQLRARARATAASRQQPAKREGQPS